MQEKMNAAVARLSVKTEQEAALFLSLSLPHLRRMRVSGTAPPHVRLGERRIGYRLGDLIDWVEERVQPQRHGP